MQPLFFDEALLPQGFARSVRVMIEGGLIARVESGATAGPSDERHAIGLPGMPNLHSHAFQRGMAGLAELRGPASDSFWTWREVMYRFAHGMGPDDVEAVAAPGQRRFVNDLDGFARLLEGARGAVARLGAGVVGVAPHSLRAATRDELVALIPLARLGPIHIHVAEQMKEVEDCLAWSGMRPVEWLLAHIPVDRAWCLIHATHMTESERDAMAKAGAVAGLCPITEANLGDGIFDAAGFVAAGGEYGVGSDSNVLVALPDELRQLEYSQRLRHRARNVLARGEGSSTGRALYEAALAGGSHALGVPKAGIREGAPADLVSLEADHPALVARQGDALLDGFVFAARDRLIDCVWRGGRKLVENGRHRERDACLARFKSVMARLLA